MSGFRHKNYQNYLNKILRAKSLNYPPPLPGKYRTPPLVLHVFAITGPTALPNWLNFEGAHSNPGCNIVIQVVT